MNKENNITAGLLVGLVSSIVVAIIWALITVTFDYQSSIMGIAAGFVVGWSVRMVSGGGKFVENGVVAAVFSLLACILGDYLTNIGYIADNLIGCTFFEALEQQEFSDFFTIAFFSFDILSFLFYACAVCIGWGIGKGAEDND